jgi:imidazolonepropionase-like amidohydrolase
MPTLIDGATIVDSVSAQPIADASMEIDAGRITRIGPRGSFPAAAGATRVDLTGKFIIPGLINAHRHLYYGGDPGADAPHDLATHPIQQNAKRLLFFGVTHAMSLGLDGSSMDRFLAAQRAGKTEGAKVLFAGYGSSAKGGWQTANVLHRPTTPEEGREAVRAEIPRGIDVVKFWFDDDHGRLPKFSLDICEAIIDEAHTHGRIAYCHMFSLSDAKEMVRRGIDVLAHSIYDCDVDDEFVKMAVDRKVAQTSTLVGHSQGVVYEGSPAFLEHPDLARVFPASFITARAGKERAQISVLRDTGGAPQVNVPVVQQEFLVAQRNAKRLSEAGIQISMGTDGGGLFGLDDHREMELLAHSGISPMRVLQIATIHPARLLKLDTDYGSLEPGKAADFLVLGGDPLADITNTRALEEVWVGGAKIDRDALATADLRT